MIKEQLKKELLLNELEKWSQKYQINFQFWGEGDNNLFIYKDDVELYNTGDFDSAVEVMEAALTWIYRVNRKKNPFQSLPEEKEEYFSNMVNCLNCKIGKCTIYNQGKSNCIDILTGKCKYYNH